MYVFTIFSTSHALAVTQLILFWPSTCRQAPDPYMHYELVPLAVSVRGYYVYNYKASVYM